MYNPEGSLVRGENVVTYLAAIQLTIIVTSLEKLCSLNIYTYIVHCLKTIKGNDAV